jgi:hypothetical protein
MGERGKRVISCLPISYRPTGYVLYLFYTTCHERHGLDLSAVPRMSADDVSDRQLARARIGEVLCAPGVERSDLLDAVFKADLAAIRRAGTTARGALP